MKNHPSLDATVNVTGEQLSFFSLYLKMITRPNKALADLFDHSRKLKYGFYALLVPAIGYTLFYLMAWRAGGAPSTFRPWLALPIEEYFKFDIFLTFPGYFVSWVTAAATLYLLSRILNDRGSFDNTLAGMGFGIGIATWSSMLHDLTDAILATIGVIDMGEYEKLLNEPTFWRYLLLSLYAIYFLWFVYLFSLTIFRTHKLKKGISLILGIFGLAVFQTMLFIFIR